MKEQTAVKRVLCLLLSVTLMLSLFGGVTLELQIKASATAVGDFSYEVLENGTCSITGYSGTATDLVIPSQIDGYTVTKIGMFAFSGLSSLTSVTIPASITSIGTYAFSDCDSISRVYISDLIGWCNMYSSTYDVSPLSYGASLYLNGELVTNLVIPEGITKVKQYMFSGCSSLTSVTIPEGVTSIEYAAFSGCKSLTSVTIHEGITKIGSYAFSGCSSLTNISIPESVTGIGAGAFGWCTSLTSVTIPEGVTGIWEGTFYNCTSLTSVTIPKSVTELWGGAFGQCAALKAITFRGTAPDCHSTEDADPFSGVTATAYYPANDPTWTEDVMQNYGGTITWVPYEPTPDEPVQGITVSGSLTSFQGENLTVELWLEGAQAASYSAVITDSSYCFENVPQGNYVLKISMDHGVTREYPLTASDQELALDVKISPMGDVTGDGRINLGDVARVYSHIRGTSSVSDEYALSCADTNGDTRINLGDAAKIYSHIRGTGSLW